MKRLPLAGGAALAAFTLAAPLFLERGTLNDLWSLAFAVILASAWNILGGFAGQVSLGYSAFLGIGAYTTVLLSLKGINPFWTLPLAAALGALFSVVIGLPAFRLRGPYFTIATIGVGEAVRVAASSASFTGGSSGLRMPAGSFDFTLNYESMARARGRHGRHRGRREAQRVRPRARRDPPGHRRRGGARRRLDALQARGPRALGRARRARGLAVRDQLPVHRARLRLRLPIEPQHRPHADRRRRRDRRGPGPRRDRLLDAPDQAPRDSGPARLVPLHLRGAPDSRHALRAEGPRRPRAPAPTRACARTGTPPEEAARAA